ncbi:MAG: DUF5710 domain-containing protein [Bacillota bacterium]
MLKLNVPFSRKDEAKSLGAYWDIERKTWYIPRSKYSDITKFKDWINIDFGDIIIEVPLYLAESMTQCWKCKKQTRVITLACHIIYDLDTDDNNQKMLYKQELGFSFISNIEKLPNDILNIMQKHSVDYKQGYTKASDTSYFNNHCSNCNSVQGDFFLHEEPGGTFCPVEDEEIKKITLYKLDINYDLIVRGSYSWANNSDEIFILSSKKTISV